MNEHLLGVRVLPQPTETTCGPTCLQGVYGFWGDALPLERVIAETGSLPDGGTLSVLLAHHALSRGYRTTIYSYNLQLFDPTWFDLPHGRFIEKLRAQAARKDERVRQATEPYVQYLAKGGDLRLVDLSEALLRRLLEQGTPILTGLSATYLYRSARERSDNVRDDVAGHPVGHFVVLAGHRSETRELMVADPWQPNPHSPTRHYWLDADRVIGAILLGIVTYDANLLIVEPRSA